MRDTASALEIPRSLGRTMSTAIFERGGAGALPHPGLEHPELALLDGELGVAHVARSAARGGRRSRAALCAPEGTSSSVPDRLGVADARHDVLALGVDQEVAVGALCAGGGSRVKPTPVPELSSRLPKTMACTFTAVPRSWAIRSRSR